MRGYDKQSGSVRVFMDDDDRTTVYITTHPWMTYAINVALSRREARALSSMLTKALEKTAKRRSAR